LLTEFHSTEITAQADQTFATEQGAVTAVAWVTVLSKARCQGKKCLCSIAQGLFTREGDIAVGAGSGAFQKGGFFIPNAASYTTPSINGWTATILSNTANGAKDGAMATTTSDPDKYMAVNVIGAVGPINVTAGYQTRGNSYSSNVIGASTTLGDLTIAGNFNTHSVDSASTLTFPKAKTSSYLLSAAYKLQESLTLVGGYGANDLSSDQSMTNVGVKLDLSKRTYTYISYVRATGGAQSSLAQRGNYALTGTGNTTTVVGVAHSF